MKALKRFTAVVASLALTVGMCVSVFAGSTWGDYIGFDGKPGHTWYEAADGKFTQNSDTSWTCKMKTIGWGGVWGAQIFQDVNITKGRKYRIKFKMKSTDINKWVVIKIAKKDKIAYVKWIHLKKGKYTKINETFVAKKNASKIIFGIGGEFGNRDDEKDIYDYLKKRPSDGKSNVAEKSTKILLRKYSLKPATKVKPSKTYCRCGCPYCK